MTTTRPSPPPPRALTQAADRVSRRGWGVALGVCCGGGLFLATAILLILGGPDPGPHLALLAIYLRGYSVTWPGAFVGLAYGAILGYLLGTTTAALYNWASSWSDR